LGVRPSITAAVSKCVDSSSFQSTPKECLARLQQHRRVHQAPATDAYAAHDADVPEEVLHEKPAKADLRNPKQLA
jgi:hypothetical protein